MDSISSYALRICKAIEDKSLIEFKVDDEQIKFEPHMVYNCIDLGESDLRKTENLYGYEIKKDSSKVKRTLRVRKICSIPRFLPEKFQINEMNPRISAPEDLYLIIGCVDT